MMDYAWRFSAAALLALTVAAGAESDQRAREAGATLVVYNAKAPDSKVLAEYYASRRGIPAAQVVGLECPADEEISREQFYQTIEVPLRTLFSRNNWWEYSHQPGAPSEVKASTIRFVALMRGMPLKIRTTIQPPAPGKPAPPRPNGGDPVRGCDEASVDSEIAALASPKNELFGAIGNPYFRRFSPILDTETAAGLMLVCRLDAPTAEIVRRMINDAIDAEQNGLFGWAYIDRRSTPQSGYRDGDEWLMAAAAQCWKEGVPVILDNVPEIFPSGFPITNAALYYGWYAGGISGALAAPDFRFQRGAIAVHIHSYSAGTLRDANSCWAAPLLARGASATLGNVYEPYLDLTAHIDIFNERLLDGFTLAESAYAATKMVSWTTIVVGDPLYRPFPGAGAAWRHSTNAEAAPWLELGEQLLRGTRTVPEQTARLSTFARQTRSGLSYEALGMLENFGGDSRGALGSLETATSLYRTPADAFRTIVERIRILQSIADKQSALKLIDRTAQRAQPSERAKLLDALRNEISPPVGSPKPANSNP